MPRASATFCWFPTREITHPRIGIRGNDGQAPDVFGHHAPLTPLVEDAPRSLELLERCDRHVFEHRAIGEETLVAPVSREIHEPSLQERVRADPVERDSFPEELDFPCRDRLQTHERSPEKPLSRTDQSAHAENFTGAEPQVYPPKAVRSRQPTNRQNDCS
jgi:hypothetical protein